MQKPHEAMTGGEAVVRELINAGFDTIFALPGVQNDALFNALHDHRDAVRVVHTRHEQGAAYMALGATLATGQPAVCSVVPGPGFLNASAALATAYALNAPLLFMTGQIPLAQIGRGAGALHEIRDQSGMLRSLTKSAGLATHPSRVPEVMSAALAALAQGRPGPVGVEVPMDVLAQLAPVRLSATTNKEILGPPVDESLLERMADALVKAASPMLFVGSGAQGVAAHVRVLAELLDVPVVSYRTGRGVVDSRSPLSFVLPEARPLWRGTDVVLALGSTMRVPLQSWERVSEQKLLRIDVDPASHDLLRKPHIALTARLEDALPRLIEMVRSKRPAPRSRHDEFAAVHADWQKKVSVLEPQISYLKVIRQCLGESGVLVDELTQVGFASRLVYPVYEPRTFLSTGYMGTLGWGFPTALGAKVARPERPIVSVTGDGGFMFASSELASAVQHKIGLVTVLFNNNQYGNVQQMQRELYGGRIIASDLVNPDFVRLAEAFGVRAGRATSPSELAVLLEGALDADEPALIEVPVGDMPSVDRFR